MANRTAPFGHRPTTPRTPYPRGRQFGMNPQAPYGRNRNR